MCAIFVCLRACVSFGSLLALGRYKETSERDYLVSYVADLSRVPAVHDSETSGGGGEQDKYGVQPLGGEEVNGSGSSIENEELAVRVLYSKKYMHA